MGLEPLLSEIVAREHMEVVAVNSDIATDCEVRRGNEVSVFIHILVLPAFEEFTLNDSGVLLSWLINGDGVV